MDIENKNYEGIKVKEELEDGSYYESIANDSSNSIFIKEEYKQELDWDGADEERLAYDENVKTWTNLEINSADCYGKKHFQCPECSVKTKYEANLNKHISFMHPENQSRTHKQVPNKTGNIQNTFSLQTAGSHNNLLFHKKTSLEIHKYVQDKERPSNNHELRKRKNEFSCINCSFHCYFKSDLIFHVYECHYNNSNMQSKKFLCPYCNRQYCLNQKLKRHMAYCNKKKILQCHYCLNSFQEKKSVKRHILTVHFKDGICQKDNNMNPANLQSCPRCGKRYHHSSNLLKHVIVCGKMYNLFQCKTCIFSTNYEGHLAAHILKHLKESNLCQNITYG